MQPAGMALAIPAFAGCAASTCTNPSPTGVTLPTDLSEGPSGRREGRVDDRPAWQLAAALATASHACAGPHQPEMTPHLPVRPA